MCCTFGMARPQSELESTLLITDVSNLPGIMQLHHHWSCHTENYKADRDCAKKLAAKHGELGNMQKSLSGDWYFAVKSLFTSQTCGNTSEGA